MLVLGTMLLKFPNQNGKSMKNYALFAGDSYYPIGGFGDFLNTYVTPEEAIQAGTLSVTECNYKSYTYDWYQVVDLNSLEIIVSGVNR